MSVIGVGVENPELRATDLVDTAVLLGDATLESIRRGNRLGVAVCPIARAEGVLALAAEALVGASSRLDGGVGLLAGNVRGEFSSLRRV